MFSGRIFLQVTFLSLLQTKKNASAKHNILVEKNDLQKNRTQNIMSSTKKNKVVIDLGLHVTGMRQRNNRQLAVRTVTHCWLRSLKLLSSALLRTPVR